MRRYGLRSTSFNCAPTSWWLVNRIALILAVLFLFCGSAAYAQDAGGVDNGGENSPSPNSAPPSASFPSVISKKDDFTGEVSYGLFSPPIIPKGYFSGPSVTLVGDFKPGSEHCGGVVVVANMERWMFLEQVDIKVGDNPPVRLPFLGDVNRSARRGSVTEALFLPCDGASDDILGMIQSAKSAPILLKLSGKEGHLTVEVPPSWVTDMIRFKELLKKGGTPVDVKIRR